MKSMTSHYFKGIALAGLAVTMLLLTPGQLAAQADAGEETFFIKAFPQENIPIQTTDLQGMRIDRRSVVDYSAIPATPERTVLTAQAPGFATVTVTDLREEGNPDTEYTRVYTIQVINEQDADNQRLITDLVGSDKLTVRFAGTRVVLEGEVEDDLMARKALAVAGAFYPNSVLNFMTVANHLQVRIKVKVLSVTRSKDTNIGLQHRGNPADTELAIPFGLTDFAPQSPFFRVFNINGSGFDLTTTVNLSRVDGEIKVLQEPTLTVLNGQSASFRVGGEVPVLSGTTVDGGVTTNTFEYRPFGISLLVTPLLEENLGLSGAAISGSTTETSGSGTPLGTVGMRDTPDVPVLVAPTIERNGIVKMFIRPEISELDFSRVDAGATTENPIILQRLVETRVAMRHGESLIIGGLITDTTTRNWEKVPFIHHVPILGELFKNRTRDEEQLELIFVLTPHIVGREEMVAGDVQNYKPKMSDMVRHMESHGLTPRVSKPVKISAGEIMIRPNEEDQLRVMGRESDSVPFTSPERDDAFAVTPEETAEEAPAESSAPATESEAPVIETEPITDGAAPAAE